MIAAALLVVAAALAVGGSFGALSIYRFESQSDVVASSTTTTTGWGDFEEPPSEEGVPGAAEILHGIPLTAGAVLALVAAVVLLMSARRPGDPALGRLFGTGAAGLLVGVVAVIWLELITFTRNVAANVAAAGPDSDFRSTFEIGVGGYLVLVGGLAALAAVVLILVPRRDPGPGPAATYAAGQPQWPGAPQQWQGAPPQWQGAPPQWAPPGPVVPPPGWGPPSNQG
jgi:hypothetical protein